MFQSNGQKTGTAASLIGDLAVGACFDGYVRCAVTGATPDAGKVFALDVSTKAVVQLDAALRASVEHVGALSFGATCGIVGMVDDSDPAGDTFGAIAEGGLFDLSVAPATPGAAGWKVTGHEAPADGFGWAFIFKTATVAQLADATPVESWGGDSVQTIKVQ